MGKNWFKSFSNERIQNILVAQWAKALYSASMEIRDTMDCFLDCQEIGLKPI